MPAVQVADLGAARWPPWRSWPRCSRARQSRQGQSVDVSLFGSAVAWLPTLLGERPGALRPGEPPLAGGLAQYSVYATADGRHVTLGALEPKFLANFLDAVGRPDLLAFARDRDRLRRELSDLRGAHARGVGGAAGRRGHVLCAGQHARGGYGRPARARARPARRSGTIAPPFALSETPAAIRRPAPALGRAQRRGRAELDFEPAIRRSRAVCGALRRAIRRPAAARCLASELVRFVVACDSFDRLGVERAAAARDSAAGANPRRAAGPPPPGCQMPYGGSGLRSVSIVPAKLPHRKH